VGGGWPVCIVRFPADVVALSESWAATGVLTLRAAVDEESATCVAKFELLRLILNKFKNTDSGLSRINHVLRLHFVARRAR
jgi:hypothetical protein